MSIEFVATGERGVGTADKRRSTQISGLFYPRQSEFIRGSSSRLPYPRIWVREQELTMSAAWTSMQLVKLLQIGGERIGQIMHHESH